MTAKRFQDDLLFSVPSLLTLSLELKSPKSSGELCPAAASTNLRDMTGRTSPELTDQSVCVCKGSVFPHPPAKTTQISVISLLLRIKDTKPSYSIFPSVPWQPENSKLRKVLSTKILVKNVVKLSLSRISSLISTAKGETVGIGARHSVFLSSRKFSMTFAGSQVAKKLRKWGLIPSPQVIHSFYLFVKWNTET